MLGVGGAALEGMLTIILTALKIRKAQKATIIMIIRGLKQNEGQSRE